MNEKELTALVCGGSTPADAHWSTKLYGWLRHPSQPERPCDSYFRRTLAILYHAEHFLALIAALADERAASRPTVFAAAGCTCCTYEEDLSAAITALCLSWTDLPGSDPPLRRLNRLVRRALTDAAVRRFLRVHLHGGQVWFNRERFGDFEAWLSLSVCFHEWRYMDRPSQDRTRAPGSRFADLSTLTQTIFAFIGTLEETRFSSGYQLSPMLEAFASSGPDCS